MEYQVVLEFDPETRAYTATVPGLPVVVDATNKRTAIRLAREAIQYYLHDSGISPAARPIVHAEIVNVKV